ncbi:hypothetical protein [Nitrosospira sp. Nsp18]|nr:hypothetical protein [Nitrosospira sp. Nsp18]
MMDSNCPRAGWSGTEPYTVTMAITIAAPHPQGRHDKRQEMKIA